MSASACREVRASTVRWEDSSRYRSVGFDVVSYDAGVGHSYDEKVPVLRALERAKRRFLLHHPSPWLTAYALVVLRARP